MFASSRVPCLKDAQLAYATYGTLNDAADNAVLLPTFYTGTHIRNEPLFGPGRAIDPARHFVVSINLFGNGYSSSPSNTDAPQDGPRFPHVTLYDNVACQHRLLTERLGVRRIALVLGWSIAAMQAYQWAAQYPAHGRGDPALLRCCALLADQLCLPRRSEGRLQADAAWNEGNYVEAAREGFASFRPRLCCLGLFPRVFSRRPLPSLGFATLEDFVRDWEEDHLKWDANDLIAKIWTWQHGDISDNEIYRGDFTRALQTIEARAIVMPCSTDMYFLPADNAAEVREMRHAELRVFESPWGHCVGSPGRVPAFQRALDEAAAELLRG